MGQPVNKTFHIDGMTCTSCENRIERKLTKSCGILDVKVSYASGTATVTFDPDLITPAEIKQLIQEMDYRVRSAGAQFASGRSVTQLLGVLAILYALYMILNRFGALGIFNVFPEAEASMGYGMLFIIGLLTSIHCVAMCGGINLSQSVSAQDHHDSGRLTNLRPSILYNLGRVISYTIVGGIVGAIGQVVSFSGAAKGAVQLAAGVFMVIMGLNMLNMFPWLRRFNLRMPKIFARSIDSGKSSDSPLIVGLLNGLMPCGPLQAMQLYALSTGSPLKGALSMLLFSLGTVPLMFGLGALSSILSKKFTGKMMTASAVLVVIMGIFMFQNGMSLTGFAVTASTGGSQAKTAVKIVDGVQVVNTTLASGRYQPITVQVGVPVKWTISAAEGTINGCNNRMIIPEYGNLEKKLSVGDNVIEFTPTRSGTFPYNCWMGMIRSSITVVDDTGSAPETDADQDSADQGILDGIDGGISGSGGCCSGSALSGAFANGRIPTDNIQIAETENGVQVATVTVNDYGYSPAVIVLEKGKDFVLKFDPENINGCNGTIYFPEYGGGLNLYQETETPVLTAESDFSFQCSMNMLHGYVKVVDDIDSFDRNAVVRDVESFTPTLGGGGGCCG